MNDEDGPDIAPRLGVGTALIMIVFLAGIPGGFIYFTRDLLVDRAQSRESETWPQTSADILDSTVDSSSSKTGRSYHPIIHYRYSVAGRSHVGNRVSLQLGYGHAESDALVRRWPAGSTATVWYQPSDPSFAVLEPKTWDGDWFLGFIIVVDVFLSLVGLVGVPVIVLVSIPLRWVRRFTNRG